MKKPDLSRLVPLGAQAEKQVAAVSGSMILAFIWSLRIPVAVAREYYLCTERIKIGAGAVMEEYSSLSSDGLYGFYIAAGLMALLAVWNYATHFMGTRADYFMRRLSSKWELHRRCFTLPGVGIALSLILSVLLDLAYKAIYTSLFDKLASGLI